MNYKPWNIKHNKFFQFLYFFTCLNLLFNWFSLYRSTNGISFIERLTFKSFDQPWLPPSIQIDPVFGGHYFGDLALAYAFSKSSNPYILELPSQTPPLGIFILKIFTFLNYSHFFYLYLITGLLLIYYSIKKMNLFFSLQNYMFSFVWIFLFSIGFIANVDRGSLYLIAVPLIFISLLNFSKTNLLYLFPAIMATSFKPQLIICFMLISFLNKENFKKFLKISFLTIFFNSISFIFFTNSINSIFSFFNSYGRYIGKNANGIILDSSSIVASIFRIIEIFYGTDFTLNLMDDINILILFPGVIFYIFCLRITLFNKKNIPLIIFLSLTFVSFFTPNSYTYTMYWMPFAFLYILINFDKMVVTFNKFQKTGVSFILIGIIFGITPQFWGILSFVGETERFVFAEVYSVFTILLGILLISLNKETRGLSEQNTI